MHHPTNRIVYTTTLVPPVAKHWLEWKLINGDIVTETKITIYPWIKISTTLGVMFPSHMTAKDYHFTNESEVIIISQINSYQEQKMS